MSLTPGATIGPYVVQSSLGAGGMGEVYRARDTRLQREVALKVLPSSLAHDPERLARFAREAQVLARLNHTHIAQVHGLEDAAGAPVLVMELVDGPTLEDRIRGQGPLPADEAVTIARQIAEAVEAAHDAGIVHRDLKPANIKIRGDGVVKVLDFGLAKAVDAAAGAEASGPEPVWPTVTSPAMTAFGMILGTAAYMAPEQARGRPVDKRADIWAFGCVLFEMLAGRRPFDGETVTDTIAAVVSREPDWAALPSSTPAHLRRLLARCLVKDPRQRLRDIGDARIDLDHPLSEAALPGTFTAGTSPWRTHAAWLIAGAAIAAGGLVAFGPRAAAPPSPDVQPIRFLVPSPEGGSYEVPGSIRSAGSVSISPDGRRLSILSSVADGRIWIQPLSATAPTLIRGTGGAQQPFWAPDGRSLGFFGQQGLKRIDLDTGAIHDLGPASLGSGVMRGASLNQTGVVLFNEERMPGIGSLAPGSNTVEPATRLDPARGDRFHAWPVFLPDGRRFLFLVRTGEEATTGIYVSSLDSPETRLITRADSNAAYASGHLLFLRGGVLLAQPFDPGRADVTGDPVTIDQRVVYNAVTGRGEFSVSQTGVLAYSGAGASQWRLAWFDRAGVKTGELDGIGHMDISSDDRRVVADRVDPQTGLRDVWVFDVARGQRTRLTFGAANDWVPIFSPDVSTVVYTSDRETPGTAQLFQKASDGSGVDTMLLETGAHKHHLDWSPDGRFLAFEENGADGLQDLWVLPMTGERTPAPILQTPFRDAQPSFSPDSRLLAYASNESGVFEVYAQTFPAGGGRWQISVNGGTNPQWRRDGREMYYLAADGKLMALDVDLKTPTFGVPRALFQTAIAGDTTVDHFAVTSDGQRFLLQDTPAAGRTGYTVVVNWLAELVK